MPPPPPPPWRDGVVICHSSVVVTLFRGSPPCCSLGRQVVLRLLRHEFFSRDGDDLRMIMGVPLLDALVGFATTIEHVDGHPVPREMSRYVYAHTRASYTS